MRKPIQITNDSTVCKYLQFQNLVSEPVLCNSSFGFLGVWILQCSVFDTTLEPLVWGPIHGAQLWSGMRFLSGDA